MRLSSQAIRIIYAIRQHIRLLQPGKWAFKGLTIRGELSAACFMLP